MVLNVNTFQIINQKDDFDDDFSNLERGRVWFDHPAIDSTTNIKLLLPQWGYTARTLLVERWLKCADCSSVKPTRLIKRKEHGQNGLRRHGDPGHGCLARPVKSHG